jgi:hypothetical protein
MSKKKTTLLVFLFLIKFAVTVMLYGACIKKSNSLYWGANNTSSSESLPADIRDSSH